MLGFGHDQDHDRDYRADTNDEDAEVESAED